jgi:hypothetical protein
MYTTTLHMASRHPSQSTVMFNEPMQVGCHARCSTEPRVAVPLVLGPALNPELSIADLADDLAQIAYPSP